MVSNYYNVDNDVNIGYKCRKTKKDKQLLFDSIE